MPRAQVRRLLLREGVQSATVAGQVVSVDQLQSTVPGLVGQMKGWPTIQRYNYATVFVDQYSRLSYVYIQKTDNAAETLMAKHAFEGYARTMGVQVQHYHTDNGRFCENVYMNGAQPRTNNILLRSQRTLPIRNCRTAHSRASRWGPNIIDPRETSMGIGHRGQPVALRATTPK
jgi:hypothetical protein